MGWEGWDGRGIMERLPQSQRVGAAGYVNTN